MAVFDEATLTAAAAGDLATLRALDERGLFLAPGEEPAAFAARLRGLQARLAELEQELAQTGALDFYGAHLPAGDRIPAAVFAAPRQQTAALYGIAVDWVPGFFTNYRMGLFFAGCACYSPEELFALFLVRRAFRDQERWLIYSRQELIAHELCHLARAPLQSRDLEELFAYQTASSGFRRAIGGMLRSPRETWLLLGAVIFLVVAQIINVLTRAPENWYRQPMPLIFAVPLLVMAWVVVKYAWVRHQFEQARRRITAACGAAAALPLLFRCTDAELMELARLGDTPSVQQWLAARAQAEWRWRVINSKFPVTGG